MNDEKELRSSESATKFMRWARRRFFRDFAWTWAPLGREICVSRKALRRTGGKIGRQVGPNHRYCVIVSPGHYNGLRAVLRGVYVVDADVALFDGIQFVPKRKASQIARKLLKTEFFCSDALKGFRRCESAWSVDFDPANGSLTLY